MNKKYELTNKSIEFMGEKLYRIRALKDFSDVKKGDFGGYIENESNLNQRGDCWIYDESIICGTSAITGDAKVMEYSIVMGNGLITGYAKVKGYSLIGSDAWIDYYATVSKSIIFGAITIRYKDAIRDCKIDRALLIDLYHGTQIKNELVEKIQNIDLTGDLIQELTKLKEFIKNTNNK